MVESDGGGRYSRRELVLRKMPNRQRCERSNQDPPNAHRIPPATPIIESHAGDSVRIHVIGANNEQNGMFSVEKHEWPIEPFMRGADQISVVEFSGSEVLDAFVPSAGGPYRLPGDYVYSNQRLPYSQSGQWGYLRVLPSGDQRLLPLAGAGAGMKSASLEEAVQVIPVAAK